MRWGRVTGTASPTLGSDEALARLESYMGVSPGDRLEIVEKGSLSFIPMDAPGTESAAYAGPVGEGYRSALAWRFSLRVGEDPATWVGLVNAHDGAVLALYDDNDYAQVKGGVYPVSNDQMCPDGCEQTGYPMPFASSRSTAAPRRPTPRVCSTARPRVGTQPRRSRGHTCGSATPAGGSPSLSP